MKSIVQARWRPLALLSVLIVSGVVVSCLLIIKAQERKEFVGNVDPESGLRCRFTISADWQQKADPNSERDPWSRLVDHNSFISRPPPIRQWLDSHILHRSIAKPVETYLTTTKGNPLPKGFHLGNGYPEPKWYAFKIVTHEHLRTLTPETVRGALL